MQRNFKLGTKALLFGCTATVALLAGTTMAAAQEETGVNTVETVVVTGTKFNADAAPAKARLDITEPQTIINRSYIEEFSEPQSDYVNLLAIVPGLTGGDTNGVGLSDGGAKNTLRGFGDGNFDMMYDGIPFGDTNGPTHHNISYFPASTIGSIDVDRGPGNAGNLGANTYGGTIKMFSENLIDDMREKAEGSYGSFNTALGILNLQSGALDAGPLGTIRSMVNVQYVHSNGALTDQDLYSENLLIKVQDEINSHWTVTLFGNGNYIKENLDDNNGITPGEVALYGKNFSLQTSDPVLPTYQPYNYTSKATDMDYLRENGDILGWIKLENTTYTYAYWNHTFSPNNQTQTYCDALNNTSEGNYPGGGWYTNAGGSCVNPGASPSNLNLVLPTGAADTNNAILAYSKENAYRVFGDILRLSEDYDFGWIHGEVREGLWWETQATHRFKYYYDSVACTNDGIDPFDVGDIAANAACGIAYRPYSGQFPAGSGSTAKNGGQATFSKAKSIEVGSILGVNELGFAKDDEHSDWTQYQPFVEVDIKALDDRLTITPGLKFFHWDHGVDAAVGQSNLCGVGANSGTKTAGNPEGTAGICPNAAGDNYTAGFITRDTLPFLEMNYKIQPSWSAYFEFAKGIYVPDISTFENSPPTSSTGYPPPETTTNYQLGTVYYADNFNFDADVYYIPIHNNFVSGTGASFCPTDPSDTCYVDTGTAVYKGVEGEGTYQFDSVFGFDAHGFSLFANGALMSSIATTSTPIDGHAHAWEPNAPKWTAAGGMIYRDSHWKFALIDKLVGPQFEDISNNKYYELHTYGDLTATAGYGYELPGIGYAQLSINVDNLLDDRKDILITENGFINSTTPTGPLPAGSNVWQNSLDQYFYQSPRSIMVTIKLVH